MFTVIITTYQRPKLVLRSVKSVMSQTYANWRIILIVDDSISDYSELTKFVAGDTRVRLLQNDANLGKNQSVNRALDILQSEAYDGHIVFLDDDDWLAEDCLANFAVQREIAWQVSERYNHTTKTSLTKNTLLRKDIMYTKDMLLLKRFTGETTHCLFFPPIKNVRFPHHIKNAEEWLFFASIAQIIPSFTYLPTPGTYTEGYLTDGLSVIQKNRSEKIQTLRRLYREVWERKYTSLHVYLYLIGRTLKTICT